MLYDSTKALLQSILQSLETGDDNRWDDQTESGNACLYEMHQMSGSLYKAYRSDNLNANSRAQSGLPERLNRAMPHVRLMVIAIRHKDRTGALAHGKAAMAEMNAPGPLPSGCSKERRTDRNAASIHVPPPKLTEKHSWRVERPHVAGRVRAAGGKGDCR